MSWPSFSGELVHGDASEAERWAYGRDFGGLVRLLPDAVLRAATVEDVVAAVRHARTLGLSVVVRGRGHTTRGQSQAAGGLILDLQRLDAIAEPDGRTVRVGAGARWSDVVARTSSVGLTPPVLTDYLDLTVGGTLSVGGVGGQSFRSGLQVDNVLELEVVTGAGERVRCSPSREQALFDACRGGLGHFGVIVEATLALEPAPSGVRVRHLTFADLPSFLAGQMVLARAELFDYLVGNLIPPATQDSRDGPWHLSVECVEYLPGRGAVAHADLRAAGACVQGEPEVLEVSYLDHVNRLRAMVSAWRTSGAWEARHPWMDVFVPGPVAEAIIELALDGLDAAALGEGYVMTYPLRGSRLRSPLPALPKGEELFLFDVLPTVGADERELAAMEARCERVVMAALAAGSTIYPIGYPLGTCAMTPEVWRQQLGRHYDALLAAREHHDPDGICSRSIGMFPPSRER